MSGRSSPVNGGYEAANAEPALRLSVRKDLFPEVRLSELSPGSPEATTLQDELEDVSGVKLETDFEHTIDAISRQKKLIVNGVLKSHSRHRHRKHKQRSRRDSDHANVNGCLPIASKRRKKTPHESRHKKSSLKRTMQVKGGKNLYLVSSSECKDEEADEDEDSESSEDEVLKCSVKLPIINAPRQSGKPYSHELSQLSTKKSKSKDSNKEKRTHSVIPCSGKPRSMLGICSSRSKKKSKKSECIPTYQSQIVDTNTIKIKIRRSNNTLETVTHTPVSISDIGQRKSKKKRAASPVASESSGEEYHPGDAGSAMSVAAPKPRNPPPKTRKSNVKNNKDKNEKTERPRNSAAQSKSTGPQSPWGDSIPEEILVKIFDYVVASQGTLPSVIRLGRVCKLWHVVSCRPELWKHVDLSQCTKEKCRTDYKLVWLLENRLSQCQTLNIAQWKVCNVSWVLACIADYCPRLEELSVAGWSRLTPEQLFDMVQGLKELQRLDLSLTSETGGSSTCLSAASVARVVENFGSRLTHLTLANNKFTALTQILSSIAVHCGRLEVLDISGALATSHPAAVPLEALQRGCPRLRVFRAANAQLVLAHASPAHQAEVAGWASLEELSIAGEASGGAVGEYRLGDEALARLVRGATRLRLLDLRGLQRLSDSALVRVPAWDLHHLFLGGCNITRQSNSCLELICQKWSHSLIELDLSWALCARVVDDAVSALADASNSKLKILNLCGSAVSLEKVKKILLKCPLIESINLSSCRALPRGMKRLYTGKELEDLKDGFDPEKVKAKEKEQAEEEEAAKKKKDSKKKDTKKIDTYINSESNSQCDESSTFKSESKSQDSSSTSIFQEPKNVSDIETVLSEKQTPDALKSSPDSKTQNPSNKPFTSIPERSKRDATPKLLSPCVQSKPDSSSTPRSEPGKSDMGSPHFSPVAKPDSQLQHSPEVPAEALKGNSWNLGHFKKTPTHKSEASPLNRIETHVKIKHSKIVEQCSPTTSVDNKTSPDLGAKQDLKSSNSWNYGNYSPMPRQDQFSSQRSPYSAQPSPAQPSPYSTQPSPYSTQPSPYSSQPSPYSAQPSPDTSQIVKSDLQKSGAWNTGNYSPMTKHHAPFSPHLSSHTSPDPGVGVKDTLRTNPNKTPTAGQFSPMSRQDRIHQSPYSPRPSVDNTAYNNKKSPGVGNFSPLMRSDCHLPSPENSQVNRALSTGRTQDLFGRNIPKLPDLMQNTSLPMDTSNAWNMDRFSQISNASSASIESLVWGTSNFGSDAMPADNISNMLNTTQQQSWTGLPPFDSTVRRPNEEIRDPWSLGQFHVEPPHQSHNTFVEQNVTFDSLSSHLGQQSHIPQSFLDEAFSERSRID